MPTSKTVTESATPAPAETELIRALSNAAFDSGDWRKDESDEPYDNVADRCDAARKALTVHVAALRAERDALIEACKAMVAETDMIGPPKLRTARDKAFRAILGSAS